jgi:cytochrome c oxidase cbb3-type subunit 3
MSRARNPQPTDVLRDHDYDGIQEYDNPVPTWLALLLYASVVAAVLYVLYYGFNLGPSLQSEYLQESHRLEAEWAEYYANNPVVPPTEEELMAAAKNPESIEVGKQQFATSCAACHGELGEGLIGPNLTDAYWLHGGSMTEIYGTVVNGVAGKGMPPWGRALAPEKIEGIVAYVRSLAGTNPPRAKAPEGEKASAK